MTIKQYGGIFGRNPTFNNVTVDGTLTIDQIVEKTGAAGIALDGVTLKDGNVVLADGKGIDFSATSGTGTSELFDDYEEGTWTPTLTNWTGSLSGFACYYTKIGRMVHVWGVLIPSTTFDTTVASSYVTGLPYNSVSDGPIVNWASGYTGQLTSIIVSNRLYAPTVGSTSSAFYFSCVYQV